MSTRKPYSQWTAEEKAAYTAKRQAWLADRKTKQNDAFNQLEAELKKLNAPANCFALLNAIKKPAAATAKSGESYMVALFGTETPANGTVSTYLYIGLRGPNNERLNDGETMKQFVTRVDDVKYKHDATSIHSMIWYLKRRGYIIENDKEKALVTFVRKDDTPIVEETKKEKAELIKKAK